MGFQLCLSVLGDRVASIGDKGERGLLEGELLEGGLNVLVAYDGLDLDVRWVLQKRVCG